MSKYFPSLVVHTQEKLRTSNYTNSQTKPNDKTSYISFHLHNTLSSKKMLREEQPSFLSFYRFFSPLSRGMSYCGSLLVHDLDVYPRENNTFAFASYLTTNHHWSTQWAVVCAQHEMMKMFPEGNISTRIFKTWDHTFPTLQSADTSSPSW